MNTECLNPLETPEGVVCIEPEFPILIVEIPQPEPTPVPGVDELADTGADPLVWLALVSTLLVTLGLGLLRRGVWRTRTRSVEG